MNGTKDFLEAVANRSGCLDTYGVLRRLITKSQIAILMYHRVGPKTDNWSLAPISLENFEKQIEYLQRNFEIISLHDLAQRMKKGKSFHTKAVSITFDDGYRDNYLYAYPVLKKHQIRADIFLTTGHVDSDILFWWDKVRYIIQQSKTNYLSLNELGNYSLQSELDKYKASLIIPNKLKKLSEVNKLRWIEVLPKICDVTIPPDLGKQLTMSWNEIREMSNNGITFGAHTVNHPILTNMSFECAKWEITQSKKTIEEKIGKPVTSFSYPNGNYNAELSKFVKEAGFDCAVSVFPSRLIVAKDDIYTLSRIGITGNFDEFKAMLCGLWEVIVEFRNKEYYRK